MKSNKSLLKYIQVLLLISTAIFNWISAKETSSINDSKKTFNEVELKFSRNEKKKEINNAFYKVSDWQNIKPTSVKNNSSIEFKLSGFVKPREYFVIMQPTPNLKNDKMLTLIFNRIKNVDEQFEFIPSYSKDFFINLNNSFNSSTLFDKSALLDEDSLESLLTFLSENYETLVKIPEVYRKALEPEPFIPVLAGEIMDISFINYVTANKLFEDLEKSKQIFKLSRTNPNVFKPNINFFNKETYNSVIQIPRKDLNNISNDKDLDKIENLFCGILNIDNQTLSKIISLKECNNTSNLCKILPNKVNMLILDNDDKIKNRTIMSDLVSYLPDKSLKEESEMLSSLITQRKISDNGKVRFEIENFTDGFDRNIPRVPNNIPENKDEYLKKLKNEKGEFKFSGNNFYNGIYVMQASIKNPDEKINVYIEYKVIKDKSDKVENSKEIPLNSTDNMTYTFNSLPTNEIKEAKIRILVPINYDGGVNLRYETTPYSISSILTNAINRIILQNFDKAFDKTIEIVIKTCKSLVNIALVIHVVLFGLRLGLNDSKALIRDFIINAGKLIFIYVVLDNQKYLVTSIKFLSFYLLGNLYNLFQNNAGSFTAETEYLMKNTFGFIDLTWDQLVNTTVLRKLFYLILGGIIRPDLGLIYWIAIPVMIYSVFKFLIEGLLIIFEVLLGYLYIYILIILSPMFSLLVFIPITRQVIVSVFQSIISFVLHPSLLLILFLLTKTVAFSLVDKILPKLDSTIGIGSVIYSIIQEYNLTKDPIIWTILFSLKEALNVFGKFYSGSAPNHMQIILSTFILYCYADSFVTIKNSIKKRLLS